MSELESLKEQLETVDAGDIKRGMAIYGQIHNISQGLNKTVTDWVFRIYHYQWVSNSRVGGTEFAKAVEEKLKLAIAETITKHSADTYADRDDEAKEGDVTLKLSGENPLSGAHRKMRQAAQESVDFDEYDTVRGAYEQARKLKKERVANEQKDKAKDEFLEGEIKRLTKDPALSNLDEEAIAEIAQENYDIVIAKRQEEANANKAIDANRDKFNPATFLFTDERIMEAVQGLCGVFEARVLSHMAATNIPRAEAINQLIDAIDGETETQQNKIDDWLEAVDSAKQKLKEQAAA